MSYRRSSIHWFAVARRQRQQGAALIIALMVFALAAALMVGLQRDFTLQLQRTSNALLMEQGWAYLRGAEELAATALRFDSEQDAARESPRDDLTELWATQATPYALAEGGWLMGQLEDLQGRFNLNDLAIIPEAPGNGGADGGDASDEGEDDEEVETPPPSSSPSGAAPRFNTAQEQFIRLLQALDGVVLSQTEAVALTEAIADFIDADDERRIDGAEGEAYRNANPPYLPANQALASVSELRAIKGVTPELYRALLPYVTVWPVSGSQINVMTAPLPLLRSLNVDGQLEPLPLAEAQRLLSDRDAGVFVDVSALLGDIVFSAGETTKLRDRLTMRSDWFLLSANVEIADRELRLYSVMQREGSTVRSHYRTQGEL